tara:strand:- start:233 stop:592 length:360 start_codon:yes stop_codon:yes gene_type:complete
MKKNIFIKKTKFLFIGATYKKNIADIRESPSIKFFNIFKKNNLIFDYYDPYIKKLNFNNNLKKYKLNSIKLNKKNLKKYDCVIILTNHDNIDYKLIKDNSKLIFDSRGVFKKSNKIIYI